ncbi:MFS general substrate transporter [Macrolepiota fuliginosa MF-IS2]|uniref:MFS general substrate transporter n=1 Tax=Macrolepiota fuliginosa MF-IS2 TaxID=1400762 RepID=A0A9P5XAF6_9AGAR|nr:MFS general substrate transporter [Macrolepiota fuliginosa MF-IS2]
MIVGITSAIQNPAVAEMERDLPATSSQFSLSIALFVLVQGLFPIVWSAISEVKGRKLVYLLSLFLATAGSIVIAVSQDIGLVIGFRCMQAAGSSAFLAIGAATLADIYEPHERGTKMGIYYTAPLLGPSLGPILGGGLTSWLGWRSIFWFCAILCGIPLLAFLVFFKDTFRKERSLTYQDIVRKRLKERAKNAELASRQKSVSTRAIVTAQGETNLEEASSRVSGNESGEIKIMLRDVSPFRPIYLVLRRWNNVTMLFVTSVMMAWQFMITYTIARTLSSKYHYEPWKIGLTSLSYGMGCLFGSVIGGRWSDFVLRRTKAKNGGVSQPEMRLKSTMLGVFVFPAFVAAGGWATQEHAHIAVVVVMLFGGGFFSVYVPAMMYSSILAYIVDANAGRSSSAVATNSVFRGIFAFISTELAVPMQDGLGDGWTYTIWAVIALLSGFLSIWTSIKGAEWRRNAEEREVKEG